MRGKEKIAIEVKAAVRIREEHFLGLRAIAGLKGLSRRILVFAGEHRAKTNDGIEMVPFMAFVKMLSSLREANRCKMLAS